MKANQGKNSTKKRADEAQLGRKAAAAAMSAVLVWSLWPAGAVSAQADDVTDGTEPVAEVVPTEQDQAEVDTQVDVAAEAEAQAAEEAAQAAAEEAAAQAQAEAEAAAKAQAEAEAKAAAEQAAAQAEIADQVDVRLDLSGAYITVNGQVVSAPATKVTVRSDEDLTFVAAPSSGYELDGVEVLGASVSNNGDGSYTIAASDVAGAPTIKVTASEPAEEADDQVAEDDVVTLVDSSVVDFDDEVMPMSASDKKSDTKPVETASVTVEVTSVSGSFVKDGTLTYTIKVTNTGDAALTDVNVTSVLTGFDETIDKLAKGESREFTTDYVVTESDADLGYIDNICRVEATDSEGKDVTARAESEISALVVDTIADVVYNGSEQAVAPVVRDAVSNEVLTEGTDYEVSYKGDVKNAGKVDVVVKGLGAYAGSVEVSYYITPALITVTTGSANKAYDGAPLSADSLEISGLKGSDSVTARVTGSQTEVGESDNTYSIDWSETTQANYRIYKENLGKLTVTGTQNSASNQGNSGNNGGSATTTNDGDSSSEAAESTSTGSRSNVSTSTTANVTASRSTTEASSTSNTSAASDAAATGSAASAEKSESTATTTSDETSATTAERTYDEATPLGQVKKTSTFNWTYVWGFVGILAAAVLGVTVWQLRGRDNA